VPAVHETHAFRVMRIGVRRTVEIDASPEAEMRRTLRLGTGSQHREAERQDELC